MKASLLLLALTVSTLAQAQHFSGGLRSGVGYWRGTSFSQETRSSESQRKAVWEKEAFLRYEPAGHFAFEVGLMHHQAQTPAYFNDILCASPLPTEVVQNRNIRDRFYGLNLRVQYKFGQTCIKGLTHAAGVALTPGINDERTTDRVYNSLADGHHTTISDSRSIRLGFAFEYLAQYNLTSRINLQSLAACRANTNNIRLVHGMTWQLGVGYRL